MKRKILYSSNEIKKIVKGLAEKITEDYNGKKLLIIGLLNGSFIFVADLIREIEIPVKVEFMKVSSYKDGKTSTGKVEIKLDVETDLSKYDVLVVDDLIDTGLTMKTVVDLIKKKDVNSIKSCVLFDKKKDRTIKFNVDYIGSEIVDKYVMGYGLNYKGNYRDIPYVFELKK